MYEGRPQRIWLVETDEKSGRELWLVAIETEAEAREHFERAVGEPVSAMIRIPNFPGLATGDLRPAAS
jgi:hypothetical protein